MHPVILLQKLNLLDGNLTALDVGTRNGEVANRLTDLGFIVDAIDLNLPATPLQSAHFEQISVEDFLQKNSKTYDVVIARHVLPFTTQPLELIEKLKTISGVFLFTCFGPQDEWHVREDVVTLGKEQLMSLFSPTQIRHYSETFEYSSTYKGNVKFWHIHTFVIDNRA